MAIRTITLSSNYTGGPASYNIYWNSTNHRFYSDSACSIEIDHVTPPTRDQFAFRYYANTSSTDPTYIYIDNTGYFTDEAYSHTWSQNNTWFARWIRAGWKVTIDPDGGSGGTAAVYRDYNGGTGVFADDLCSQEIDELSLPVKDGYSCKGIYRNSTASAALLVDADGVIQETFKTSTITQAWTVIAKWLSNYKITLTDNGGSGGMGDMWYDRWSLRFTSDSYSSQVIDSVSVPTKSGSTFNGYWTANSGGTQVVAANGDIASSYAPTGAATLYARWIDSHTLTFNPNGGSVYPSSKTVAEGSAVGDLPTPTLANNNFLGWFSAASGGTQYNSSTVYTWTTNQTWYAHWQPIRTLTFNPNGGSVYPTSKTVAEGDTIGELPTPTLTDNYFAGWYTEQTGGSLITESSSYTWSADKTIYAHWTPKPTLTFDPNEGTVSPTSKICSYDEQIGEMPTPTRSGYFFDGWYTATVGGNLVEETTVYSWSGDYTVHAHWTLDEQYTLRFNPNGGSVDPTTKTVRPNQAIGTMPTPTQTAYVFDGWFTSASGGDEWTSSTLYPYQRDGEVFAHWSPDPSYPRTLNFDAGRGSVSPTSKTVYYGSAIGSLPTPTRSAHNFDGWYTAETGGTLWTSSTTYPYTDDFTVYAHWTPDPAYQRTLVFNANGGTVSPGSMICTYGETIGAMPTPTNGVKKFMGWYYGGSLVSSETVCDWSGSRTVSAEWADSLVGIITDYFALGNNNFVPIASDSGDNVKRTCVTNAILNGTTQSSAGRYSVGVDHVSGVWRNPTVTYRCVKTGTFAARLGRAFPLGSNISGYMIVSVEVDTQLGEFPTVTVSAVANEGADAINYFDVSIPVVANCHAQNLLSSLTLGNCELQTCKLVAKCDPVVLAENNFPCASDVVRGKISVSADFIAKTANAKPSAASGYVSLGEPKRTGQGLYASYSMTVEKEIA